MEDRLRHGQVQMELREAQGTRHLHRNAPAPAESWSLLQNLFWKSQSKCFPPLKKQPNQTLSRCKSLRDLHRSIVCSIACTEKLSHLCLHVSQHPWYTQRYKHEGATAQKITLGIS